MHKNIQGYCSEVKQTMKLWSKLRNYRKTKRNKQAHNVSLEPMQNKTQPSKLEAYKPCGLNVKQAMLGQGRFESSAKRQGCNILKIC